MDGKTVGYSFSLRASVITVKNFFLSLVSRSAQLVFKGDWLTFVSRYCSTPVSKTCYGAPSLIDIIRLCFQPFEKTRDSTNLHLIISPSKFLIENIGQFNRVYVASVDNLIGRSRVLFWRCVLGLRAAGLHA